MPLALIRKAIILTALLATLILTACSSTGSSPEPTNPPGPNTTATVTALINIMTFVGKPTVKAGTGTTFEVDGQVKNGDSRQHDIFVKATLLNAAGTSIGEATTNVDNVAGGALVSFAISITASEPTWKTVQVSVVNVTENINGAGQD